MAKGSEIKAIDGLVEWWMVSKRCDAGQPNILLNIPARLRVEL